MRILRTFLPVSFSFHAPVPCDDASISKVPQCKNVKCDGKKKSNGTFSLAANYFFHRLQAFLYDYLHDFFTTAGPVLASLYDYLHDFYRFD